jgi:hypothetical protein
MASKLKADDLVYRPKKLSSKVDEGVRTRSNTGNLSPMTELHARNGNDSKTTKLDAATAKYLWRKDAKMQRYIEVKGKLRKA